MKSWQHLLGELALSNPPLDSLQLRQFFSVRPALDFQGSHSNSVFQNEGTRIHVLADLSIPATAPF